MTYQDGGMEHKHTDAGINLSKYKMMRNEVENQVREELDPKGSNPGHHIFTNLVVVVIIVL